MPLSMKLTHWWGAYAINYFWSKWRLFNTAINTIPPKLHPQKEEKMVDISGLMKSSVQLKWPKWNCRTRTHSNGLVGWRRNSATNLNLVHHVSAAIRAYSNVMFTILFMMVKWLLLHWSYNARSSLVRRFAPSTKEGLEIQPENQTLATTTTISVFIKSFQVWQVLLILGNERDLRSWCCHYSDSPIRNDQNDLIYLNRNGKYNFKKLWIFVSKVLHRF